MEPPKPKLYHYSTEPIPPSVRRASLEKKTILIFDNQGAIQGTVSYSDETAAWVTMSEGTKAISLSSIRDDSVSGIVKHKQKRPLNRQRRRRAELEALLGIVMEEEVAEEQEEYSLGPFHFISPAISMQPDLIGELSLDLEPKALQTLQKIGKENRRAVKEASRDRRKTFLVADYIDHHAYSKEPIDGYSMTISESIQARITKPYRSILEHGLCSSVFTKLLLLFPPNKVLQQRDSNPTEKQASYVRARPALPALIPDGDQRVVFPVDALAVHELAMAALSRSEASSQNLDFSLHIRRLLLEGATQVMASDRLATLGYTAQEYRDLALDIIPGPNSGVLSPAAKTLWDQVLGAAIRRWNVGLGDRALAEWMEHEFTLSCQHRPTLVIYRGLLRVLTLTGD